MIQFLDLRNELPHFRISVSSAFRSKIPASGAGEMIVMPSYLIHLVHPNHGKDSRAIVGTSASFGWPRSYQAD